MKHDAFLRKHTPVVKSEPNELVLKVGWTDEARAAAAESRQRNLAGKKTSIMTQSHFENLAHSVRWAPTADKEGLANHFADSLQETSPKFNRGKFMDAATGKKELSASKLKPMRLTRAHYEHLAGTIAAVPEGERSQVAHHFARELRGSNPNYQADRFERVASGSAKKSAAFKTTPETARPPGPRVIDVDTDQDSLARTWESGDPTDSYSPGRVTDAPEEGKPLFRPVGKRDDQVVKVGWTDEAREAAAAARARRNPGPPEPHRGAEPPPVDHPVYQQRQRASKWNVPVGPLNATYHLSGRMLRQRMPDMTKEHHVAAGDLHVRNKNNMDRWHREGVDAAMRNLKGAHPGPLISGIVSDKFPQKTKERLRTLAGGASEAGSAAMAHYAAARLRPNTARYRYHGGSGEMQGPHIAKDSFPWDARPPGKPVPMGPAYSRGKKKSGPRLAKVEEPWSTVSPKKPTSIGIEAPGSGGLSGAGSSGGGGTLHARGKQKKSGPRVV